MPGFASTFPGRGWFGRGRRWFGRGGGRGWRHWYYATGMPGWARYDYGMPAYGPHAAPYVPEITPNEEREMLKEQSALLRRELKDVEERISTLEKAQTQEKE